MASFFSLGGGRGNNNNNNREDQQAAAGAGNNPPQPNQISPESWLLYNNARNNPHVHPHHHHHPPDLPHQYRGFELWQQPAQQDPCHIHQQRHHNLQDFYPGGGGGAGASGTGGGVNTLAVPNDRTGSFLMMRSSGNATSSGGGMITCQDCGNQAKKDCSHMRCRTCCKSRGFDCQTHVRSTWVPAAKRRERQLQGQHQQLVVAATTQQQQQKQQQQKQQQHQQLRPNTRDDTSASLSKRHRRTNTSGMELGDFPAEVNAEAIFRCVRVSSVDDADEQYAYQTNLKVKGHLFKGILYDQGPECTQYNPGESSSGASAAASTASRSGASQPTSTFHVDPSNLYSIPINSFVAASSHVNCTSFQIMPKSTSTTYSASYKDVYSD